MRLAFFIFRYFPHGGLQRNFLNIAGLCRDRGHEVSIFTMDWVGEKPPGLDITVSNFSAWTNDGRALQFSKKLPSLLTDRKIDAIIGFNKIPGLDVYYAGDPCYVERIRRNYPAWQVPIIRLTPRYRNFRWLEEGVFHPRSSTKILILTPTEEQNFRKHYQTQATRFHVLPPGILPDRQAHAGRQAARESTRRSLGISEGDHCLLLIGAAFRTKGLDRALYALASLPQELRKRTVLLAVGDNRVMRFQLLARRLRVYDNVRWLYARQDIPELMACADLLLHPAVCDAGGGVILEAMVAGVPVLTTEVCGYAQSVREAQAGVLVSLPFQQETLNVELRKMLISPERMRWGKNGQTFTQRQDLQRHFHEAADIIETTAKGKLC